MPFSKNDPNINREGRPKKGESFKDILRRRLETFDSEDMSRAERLMQVLEGKAMDGDLKAIDMILDRVDGKAVQHIDSTNENKVIVEHEITD